MVTMVVVAWVTVMEAERDEAMEVNMTLLMEAVMEVEMEVEKAVRRVHL